MNNNNRGTASAADVFVQWDALFRIEIISGKFFCFQERQLLFSRSSRSTKAEKKAVQ